MRACAIMATLSPARAQLEKVIANLAANATSSPSQNANAASYARGVQKAVAVFRGVLEQARLGEQTAALKPEEKH